MIPIHIHKLVSSVIKTVHNRCVFIKQQVVLQWCLLRLMTIKRTVRKAGVSLDDTHGLPVQEGISRRGWGAGNLRLQREMFLKPEIWQVLQLVGPLSRSTRCPPVIWDRERSSEEDPELPVKGVYNCSSQNSDELPVQVGVCPGEAAEVQNNLLHDSQEGAMCLKGTKRPHCSPVAAMNHCLYIHQEELVFHFPNHHSPCLGAEGFPSKNTDPHVLQDHQLKFKPKAEWHWKAATTLAAKYNHQHAHCDHIHKLSLTYF